MWREVYTRSVSQLNIDTNAGGNAVGIDTNGEHQLLLHYSLCIHRAA
jgi:hypothetical protein